MSLLQNNTAAPKPTLGAPGLKTPLGGAAAPALGANKPAIGGGTALNLDPNKKTQPLANTKPLGGGSLGLGGDKPKTGAIGGMGLGKSGADPFAPSGSKIAEFLSNVGEPAKTGLSIGLNKQPAPTEPEKPAAPPPEQPPQSIFADPSQKRTLFTDVSMNGVNFNRFIQCPNRKPKTLNMNEPTPFII